MLTLVILRLALAAVFCAAAVGKLLDPTPARALADRYRLAPAMARAAGFVPAVELAIAVALLVDASSRLAAAAGAGLLVLFSVLVMRDLRAGRTDGCGCFGRLGPKTSPRSTLLRNIPILGASLAVAVSPSAHVPYAATALALVVVAGSLAAAIRGRPRAVPAAGQRLLLFLDPDCGHCRSLLPALSRWSKEAQLAELHVVTRAGIVLDDEFVAHVPATAIVVADSGELARRYDISGSPAAVVLDPHGELQRIVVGSAGVEALLESSLVDDSRRLQRLVGGRGYAVDRRRALALGAGSVLGLALPGAGLGADLRAAIAGESEVTCPSCGDCTIYSANGSLSTVTSRPCKQDCSARKLCAGYANKLPAYLQLAAYLRAKGYSQIKEPVAQGLEQNGALSVFALTTEFTSSSPTAPRAVLFYTLTNSAGTAWVVFMSQSGKSISVATAGSTGQITTASVPTIKLPTTSSKTTRQLADASTESGAGPNCVTNCKIAMGLGIAMASLGAGVLAGSGTAYIAFAASILSGGIGFAGAPNASTMYAADTLTSIIGSASMVDYIARVGSKFAYRYGRGELCPYICSYTLKACCSYGGGCYDALGTCASRCPESLKYQAPCLVYLTGNGANTYLGRF